MATSGTVGRTRVSVVQMIEEAFRRTGKLSPVISGEQLTSARLNLFMLCAALATRGLSLWCVQKTVLGVEALATVYNLPIGTVDVLDALWRKTTELLGSTIAGAGYQGLQLSAGSDYVYTVGVKFSAAVTVNLVVESSPDGGTWTQRAAFPTDMEVAAGVWAYQDVDNTVDAPYWRIRDTSGTLPTVSSLVMANQPYEVPMAKLNRDDYTSYPNKTFAAPSDSNTLQYWYDKQINPRIWVWPASQNTTDQIVVWTQSQMQDVGKLTNELAVPQRWYEGIIMILASRCALIVPPNELPPGRLEFLTQQADVYLTQAENSENDGSNIRIAPNIRGYTA